MHLAQELRKITKLTVRISGAAAKVRMLYLLVIDQAGAVTANLSLVTGLPEIFQFSPKFLLESYLQISFAF